MKSFEYSGMWWLPSHSEYTVSGKLTFVQNDRIDIALDSILEPDRDVLRERTLKRYPLILGVTDDGQAITLFDCRETNVEHITSDEGSYAKHECSAIGAYIGAHLTSREPLFHKMDVHYSHLP